MPSSSEEGADYEIESDESNLRLINCHAALNQSPIKLPFAITNIISLANLIAETEGVKGKISLDGTQKFLVRFEKRFKKDDKNASNLSELKKLLEAVTGLSDLPKHFIEIPYFAHFQVCQILILEKGMPNCLNLTFDRASGLHSEKMATQKFNQLITQVKKSKSKIFTKATKGVDLNVLGSYFAKEFESQSYSVLLIVSRNDFLPTTDDERAHFDEISNGLFLVLDNILFSDRFIQKESQMISALYHHIIPMMVVDENAETIFENICAKELSFKDFSKATSYKIKKKTLYIFHRPADELGRDFLHLERINLLGELLNTLKHEVSNPLFGIELGAQVLREDFPQESETFTEIGASVARCRDIIHNFHSLYQSPHKRAQTDIVKLVQEIMVLTKSETRQIRKKILIDSVAMKSEGEEPIFIKTHSTWLGQIIFNLIINSSQSLKARTDQTPQAKLIQIEIERHPSFIRILISDNGPGIEATTLPYIFKPFYTTKTQGTGLGLAICTNLVKKLSGNITVSSDQTLPWTSFSLEFPYE